MRVSVMIARYIISWLVVEHQYDSVVYNISWLVVQHQLTGSRSSVTTNSITVLHHQLTGSRTSVLRHQCYQYHYICIDYIYWYYTIRASALQTRRDYIYCYYIYCYYTTRASAFTVTTVTVTTLSACSLMFVTQSTTIVIHNACSYMSAVQTTCTKHVHASCIIG